jgi:glycosyltransferase involved in cell wall biosynthesis
MPRVTVIIPTYNWSTVLPYSVGSVMRQTFRDLELLVVGDGCTDDSGEVVQRVGDERVRWINLSENTGEQSTPNNEGLRQAQGELIAYLGHDDLWMPHHLSCLVEAIDAGADIAHTIVRTVYPEDYPEGKGLRRLMKRPPSRFLPSSAMHRRSVTDKVGGWRHYKEITSTPQDDLWERAVEAGFNHTAVPRLSVFKLPAKDRRDVYKERPSHEQAAWFERIGRESDLEAVELGTMLIEMQDILYTHVREQTSSYSTMKKWLKQLRPKKAKGAKIDAWREFKGLERKS